jgi:hypothetical protein
LVDELPITIGGGGRPDLFWNLGVSAYADFQNLSLIFYWYPSSICMEFFMTKLKVAQQKDVADMSVVEKYLEGLTGVDDWLTVSEWASRVGERFPDLLAKANKEAMGHKNPTTGIREIAARISSHVSTGKFAGRIEVDESERPKKIRRLSAAAESNYIEDELASDLEPLTRTQRIRADEERLNSHDRYRLWEMDSIVSSLREFSHLDFEIDHARALLNADDPGEHHPDNAQILLKLHNRQKSARNWKRFSLEEQIAYIKAAVQLQKLVVSQSGQELRAEIIESILDRLKAVY